MKYSRTTFGYPTHDRKKPLSAAPDPTAVRPTVSFPPSRRIPRLASFRRPPGGGTLYPPPMSDLSILIRNNAPLFITADRAAHLRFTGHTGAESPLPPGEGIARWRRGLSKRTPSCDPAHREAGWDGTLDPPVFALPVAEPPKP